MYNNVSCCVDNKVHEVLFSPFLHGHSFDWQCNSNSVCSFNAYAAKFHLVCVLPGHVFIKETGVKFHCAGILRLQVKS